MSSTDCLHHLVGPGSLRSTKTRTVRSTVHRTRYTTQYSNYSACLLPGSEAKRWSLFYTSRLSQCTGRAQKGLTLLIEKRYDGERWLDFRFWCVKTSVVLSLPLFLSSLQAVPIRSSLAVRSWTRERRKWNPFNGFNMILRSAVVLLYVVEILRLHFELD